MIATTDTEIKKELMKLSKGGLVEKVMFAMNTLDKLSKLGNEPYIGNSVGNCIARDTLCELIKIDGDYKL